MSKSTQRRARARITLDDVAKHVGVSAITVSRALRTPELVSAPVAEKIEQAVRELGYIPNRMASALASARTRVIGVAIPSLTNVVFVDVIQAIYDSVQPSGYQVLLGNFHYSPLDEERLVSTLIEQGAEALILTGLDQTRQTREIIHKARLPVVQIMETGSPAIDMNVGFSHFQAGYDLTRRLVAEGYRRVAFMGARMDPRTQRRMEGYKKAMDDQGLDWRDKLVTTPRRSTVKLGCELLRDLLARNVEVDALFCCNDDLAMGAIFEAQRMNVRVPGELAIAGFNDLEGADVVNPALTTVATPRYEMGKLAVEMILERLNHPDRPPRHAPVDLGYEIVIRQST